LEALKLLPALAVLVVLVSTLVVNFSFAQDVGYSIYENSDMGLRVEYPSGTYIDDSVLGTVFFYAPLDEPNDNFNENILIITENLLEPITLEEFVDLSVADLEFAGFSVTDSKPTTLDKNLAMEITISMEIEGQKIDQTQIVTIKDQTVYLIAITTLPQTTLRYMPTFEKMVDSFEFLGGPNLISGNYSIEEIGLEIEFPPGWDGIEVKGEIIMAMATPGITIQPFSQSPELSSQLEMSMIMILVGNFKSIETMMEEQTPPDTECEPHSSTIIELNGMTTHELLTDCQSPDLGTVKGLQYTMFTQDDAILVMYIAISQDPEKTFNQEISAFEESLKTLRIDNTIDVLGPADYADLFDQTLFTHAVMIDNKLRDVEIVSDTRIDKFSFNEEKREISFKIIKQEDTREDTTIFVDDILLPPYTVTRDEYKPIDDFLVTEDKKTGRTTISFYDHAGIITITGSPDSSFQKEMIKPTIPDWIRNNAEWWAQGAIGDSDFVSGIQYLIKEGIMHIPETEQTTSAEGAKEIPSWIKNNADWWAQGLISDDDFLKGIQYLVENGIIVV